MTGRAAINFSRTGRSLVRSYQGSAKAIRWRRAQSGRDVGPLTLRGLIGEEKMRSGEIDQCLDAAP